MHMNQYPQRLQRELTYYLIKTPSFFTHFPGLLNANYFSAAYSIATVQSLIEHQDGTYEYTPSSLFYLVLSKGYVRQKDKKDFYAWFRDMWGCTKLTDSRKKYLQEVLLAFCKRGHYANMLIKCAEDLREGHIDMMTSRLTEALRVGATIDAVSMDALDPKLVAGVLDDCQVGRVTTGYKSVDELMEGGLGAGELGVVLGPTSRGKSLVMQDLAVNAMRHRFGTNVEYISLEMSVPKIMRRFYSRITGIPREDLGASKAVVERRLEIFQQKTGSNLSCTYMPPNKTTVKDIAAHCKRAASHGRKPDLLIIDYADLMKSASTSKLAERRHDLSEIYRDLSALAIELNIPIWTPSQTNRKGFSAPTVDIPDIAEDYGKATIADVVIALCQTDTERENNDMRLFLAKNRENRARVSVQTVVDYRRMKLRDVGVLGGAA